MSFNHGSCLSGIPFIPDQGTVLRCDFRGYLAAEIGEKSRPVIVVSPRRLNGQTVCVAPLSHAWWRATPLDVCIPADRYDFFNRREDKWVKTQLLAHVALSRLDRIRVDGRWCAPRISVSDLHRVLAAINSIFTAPAPALD